MVIDFGMVSFLFILYYVFHLLGDYAFQTDYEACNKTADWLVRAHHSLVYSLWVFAIPTTLLFLTGSMAMSLTKFAGCWAIFVISHFFIDDRRFVLWWRKFYAGDYAAKEEVAASHIKTHVVITLDQTLHLLIILCVSILIVVL